MPLSIVHMHTFALFSDVSVRQKLRFLQDHADIPLHREYFNVHPLQIAILYGQGTLGAFTPIERNVRIVERRLLNALDCAYVLEMIVNVFLRDICNERSYPLESTS